MEITTLLKEKQNLTETRSMESQSYISQFQKGQDSNNFFGDFHSSHLSPNMNALLPLSLSIIFLIGSQLNQKGNKVMWSWRWRFDWPLEGFVYCYITSKNKSITGVFYLFTLNIFG